MGETFEENSLIKAKAVKDFCIKNGIKKIVVADDAGLMVDAIRTEDQEYIQQGMQEIMLLKK
ncbi:MAG: non-canonical purine NTP pyrophosphatase [Clostridia bacterium]|nr:non-canonical purine NTP pyrophosphatase [Clostridia bacterium]